MNTKKILKNIERAFRYPIEGILGWISYFLTVTFLSIESSSAVYGFLTRKLAPITGAHRTGRKNLKRVYPNMSDEEIEETLKNVWENFGRTMGEYPFLRHINIYQDSRFEILGAKYIDQMRDDGKPGIIFGAHLASWEVAIMAASQRGLDLAQLYRTMNNPIVDKIVSMVQAQRGNQVLRKGSESGRDIIKLLRDGRHLFLLNDQRLDEGVAMPFMGHDCMTASAAARMALKFDCPLLPVQVERLEGVSYRITFHPPIEIKQTGDIKTDVYNMTFKMNEEIESWVRHRPDQWLWIHNRWKMPQ